MNRENKMTLLVFLSALLCIGIIFAVYHLSGRLEALQARSDALEQRIVNARADTEILMEQKRVFTDVLGKLDDENYHVKPARDETEFYTTLQEAARDSGVAILSTRQQGVNQNGISTMTFSLQGEYYSMLRLLAAWRDLPMTVRVANLTLRRAGQGLSDLNRIVADTTVETVFSSGTNVEAGRR